MREIEIHDINGIAIIEQLNTHIQGKITEEWGEYVLEFDNELGKGMIRSIAFDWGITLLDYDVNFIEDTKIVFHIKDASPVEFIFVSEGQLGYSNDIDKQEVIFERYQNIIIAAKQNTKERYIFPKKVAVKVNFIYVVRKEYNRKKNHNIPSLDNSLSTTFKDKEAATAYEHYGNFSLKIADQIKQLQENYNHGIIRTLSIEGQLNLIMAMQMVEHNNHERGIALPESLSKKELKKIHSLASYIVDNIAEPLTVAVLGEESGLSSRKLQLGFRVLYSKSVNEYVRQIKLELARDYLKTSSLSISEIVYNIGFKSRSYFSKIFFEHYGVLPTDYRKRLKRK